MYRLKPFFHNRLGRLRYTRKVEGGITTYHLDKDFLTERCSEYHILLSEPIPDVVLTDEDLRNLHNGKADQVPAYQNLMHYLKCSEIASNWTDVPDPYTSVNHDVHISPTQVLNRHNAFAAVDLSDQQFFFPEKQGYSVVGFHAGKTVKRDDTDTETYLTVHPTVAVFKTRDVIPSDQIHFDQTVIRKLPDDDVSIFI